MSVSINNSPVHSDSIITQEYGVVTGGACGYHTGVDIAPYGDTSPHPFLYPVFSGEVVQVNLDSSQALGLYVTIRDTLNRYWRYCHMSFIDFFVTVGTQVTPNGYIGRMGDTGNTSGIHLHLECSTTLAWDCSTFINPCTELGIPNVDNTVIEYSRI